MKEKKLQVKSRTENLSKIREFIQNFSSSAGIMQDTIDNMMLAVDEACTNIIKHAYKSYPDGEIIIKIKYEDKKLIITIIDYGKAFHPESVPEPNIQEFYRQHRVGGLGMYLMKTLMDDVKYVSIPGKYNQVLLSKSINSPR
ncbi:MAG: serine/threonine protein kinase [Ignavibacteria bacterium RBG_16_34_14]|nr:MAG: serine/threonine protein kinase [Ignavibacteria bacterium RBG_16_34_14]